MNIVQSSGAGPVTRALTDSNLNDAAQKRRAVLINQDAQVDEDKSPLLHKFLSGETPSLGENSDEVDDALNQMLRWCFDHHELPLMACVLDTYRQQEGHEGIYLEVSLATFVPHCADLLQQAPKYGIALDVDLHFGELAPGWHQPVVAALCEYLKAGGNSTELLRITGAPSECIPADANKLTQAIGDAPKLRMLVLSEVSSLTCESLLAGAARNAGIRRISIDGDLHSRAIDALVALVGKRQLKSLALQLRPAAMTCFVNGLALLDPPARMNALTLRLFSNHNTFFAAGEKFALDKAFTRLAKSGCVFENLDLPAEILRIEAEFSMLAMIRAFISSRICRVMTIEQLQQPPVGWPPEELAELRVTLQATAAVNSAMSLWHGAGFVKGAAEGFVKQLTHSAPPIVAPGTRNAEVLHALVCALVHHRSLTYADIRAVACLSRNCVRRAREGRAIDALLFLVSAPLTIDVDRVYFASIASMLGITHAEFKSAAELVFATRAQAMRYWPLVESNGGTQKTLLKVGVERAAWAFKRKLPKDAVKTIITHPGPRAEVRVSDFVDPERFVALPDRFMELDGVKKDKSKEPPV